MSELRALRHLVDNSSLREKVGDRLPDEFEACLKEAYSWSYGEKILLELAYNLWTGLTWASGPNVRRDLIDRLDDDNYRAVLQAILILRPVTLRLEDGT